MTNNLKGRVNTKHPNHKFKKKMVYKFNKYLPPVAGALTSLTANKNCIAQTSKQQRFNDNDSAHKANVTSYTMAKSSGDVGPGGGGGSRPPGDIFKRNIKESSANSKETANRKKNIKNLY